MTVKQILNSGSAPDGSLYVTLTDGAGNLVTAGGGSGGITIGTTTITGGADTQVLFNNAGVVSSDAGLTKIAGATGAVTAGGLLRTSSAGAVTTPSISVGNTTTGLYSVSTTGLGLAVNGVNKLDFGINNAGWTFGGAISSVPGVASTSVVTANAASGIVAGGGAVAFRPSSNATLGIYCGSGTPTISAGQGSIYINSAGSGTADRLWVNTNGTTGWTNFVTAT